MYLKPLIIAQKAVMIASFGKCKIFPPNLLFKKKQVFMIKQICIKLLAHKTV